MGALENVWRKWRDYRECRLKRKDLAEKNFFTTYCIALLRFLEENLGALGFRPPGSCGA